LYFGDRVQSKILRLDPRANDPVAVPVATIAARSIDGMEVKADPGGLAFDGEGNLYIASAPFAEVLRVPAAALNESSPGAAQTFATGVTGANGVLFDGAGNLLVSGGASGNIYRITPAGGEAQVIASIERFTRAVPPDNFMQSVVANGMVFDAQGNLLVADTARGAIWKIALSGGVGTPSKLVEAPELQGIDGLARDSRGMIWGAVNELNELVTISAEGAVQQMFKNGSDGPLEFPSALVFVGNRAYISNFDRARRDNFAEDGMTSLDGAGASIVIMAQSAPAPANTSSSYGY
jgi:sugar lactone lactonase YvrE